MRRGQLRPDQLDPVAVEGAVLREGHREVEAGLPAHGGQHRLGPLARDDLGHVLGGEGLDVRAVRHLRVGHDGGRVAVHQHDLEPLLAQGLAGLGARVVELAGLADHDRPRADEEDLADVGALRHVGS